MNSIDKRLTRLQAKLRSARQIRLDVANGVVVESSYKSTVKKHSCHKPITNWNLAKHFGLGFENPTDPIMAFGRLTDDGYIYLKIEKPWSLFSSLPDGKIYECVDSGRRYHQAKKMPHTSIVNLKDGIVPFPCGGTMYYTAEQIKQLYRLYGTVSGIKENYTGWKKIAPFNEGFPEPVLCGIADKRLYWKYWTIAHEYEPSKPEQEVEQYEDETELCPAYGKASATESELCDIDFCGSDQCACERERREALLPDNEHEKSNVKLNKATLKRIWLEEAKRLGLIPEEV